MKKRVLILGAGYGGIFAAANLCKEGLFDITIVDKSQYHQLLQQIHHIISKSKKPEDIIIRIEELFKDDKGRNLSIVNAAIKGIDLDRKTAKMQESDGTTETQYDYAIVSLGAETQYFGIKGAEEHCMPFRSAQDALKIQKKVEDLPPGSTVVIAGGGPTGVSLAAAMVEMDAVKDKKIKVNVVDSSESLLPGWDARLTATSERVLSAKGVELTTRKRIKEVRADSIIVESGEKMQSDCTIWTAGVKGRDIHITPEVEKTKSGRIVVDQYSRIPGFEDAFAIGDISAFKLTRPGGDSTIAPQLAQFAVRQGRFVADNIVKKENGKEMNDRLSFCQRGHTIALGQKSLGLLSGLLVTGTMCNYTEDSIVDNLVMEIKNKEQGVSARAAGSTKEAESKDGSMEYPASFNFVTYATSDAFYDLVR